MTYFSWAAGAMMVFEVLMLCFSTATNHIVNAMYTHFRSLTTHIDDESQTPVEVKESLQIKKVMQQLKNDKHPSVQKEQNWIKQYNIKFRTGYIFIACIIFLVGILYPIFIQTNPTQQHRPFLLVAGIVLLGLTILGIIAFYIREYRTFTSVPKLMQQNSITGMATIIKQIRHRIIIEACCTELMTVFIFLTIVAAFETTG